MEHTPKQVRFPYVIKEVICSFIKSMNLEPGRRKQDVIPSLRQCKIFNFAGHGDIDDKDPSRSHLLLENGKGDPITVASLLYMNLHEHSPFRLSLLENWSDQGW
jgi:hypothetical protein